MSKEADGIKLNTNPGNNINDQSEAEKIKNPLEETSKIEDLHQDAIQKTVQELEDYIEASSTTLNLQLDQNTGRLIFKVISKDGNVIRKMCLEEDT